MTKAEAKLLLTPALRKEVEEVINAAYEKCETHYKRKFKRPEVHYDLRNTNAGEAWRNRNLIRLNLTFLVENGANFKDRTPGHEVAHLVARAVYDSKPMNGKKVRPHGVEWKEVMGVIGQEPSVKHSFDITSLDIHKRPRKKRIVSPREKIQRILQQVKRLDPALWPLVTAAIETMKEEA